MGANSGGGKYALGRRAKYAQNMRKYALKYAQNMRNLEYAHVEPTKKWGSLDQILVKTIFLESADDADHKNILVQKI